MADESPPLRVAGVLLAGGASRRFGTSNKLLADVGGIALLRRTGLQISAAHVHPMIVVTGAEHDAYAEALSGLNVTFVANPAWQAGIGGSIATGVRALPHQVDGTFIVPGDMANLTAAMLRGLIAAFEHGEGRNVIVPVTKTGAQRNPVLWPRSKFAALATLTGDRGGKSLLDTVGGERLDVVFDEDDLFADIDTPDDLKRFIAGTTGDGSRRTD